MDSNDSSSSENSLALMMMMMMQGGSMGDMNSILPLLLFSDDDANESSGIDFMSLFLFSSMLQTDCSTSTDNQFSIMLPLMLMGDD